MIIWYDILFVVNSISKKLQSKDIGMDVPIEQLKGLISFFFLKNIEKMDLKIL